MSSPSLSLFSSVQWRIDTVHLQWTVCPKEVYRHCCKCILSLYSKCNDITPMRHAPFELRQKMAVDSRTNKLLLFTLWWHICSPLLFLPLQSPECKLNIVSNVSIQCINRFWRFLINNPSYKTVFLSYQRQLLYNTDDSFHHWYRFQASSLTVYRRIQCYPFYLHPAHALFYNWLGKLRNKSLMLFKPFWHHMTGLYSSINLRTFKGTIL